MFCPKCGTQVEDTAANCSNCNHELREVPAAPVQEAAPAAAPVEEATQFCPYCASKIAATAAVCPICNQAIAPVQPQPVYEQATAVPPPPPAEEKTNVMAIVGLVGAFLMPLLGLIFGIIGLNKSKEMDGNGKGMSIAAIVISAISMVITVLLVIAYIVIVVLAVMYGETNYEYASILMSML